MWVIVPCKKLELAKQRLAPILSAAERRLLSVSMLSDTLAIATTTAGVEGVMVVSSDPFVADIAKSYGARCFSKHSDTNLSFALTVARSFIQAEAMNGIITIPIDLPRLSSADISNVLASVGDQPSVALAPAAKDNGTNLIAMSPASVIPYLYGNNSFHHHVQAAQTRQIKTTVIRSRGLSLDIDRPDDLYEFVSEPSLGLTFQYLQESGIRDRMLASNKTSSQKIAVGGTY
jgi:2-phospho-L-lactate guanylyltransferase